MTATTGTIAMSLAQDIRREHEAAQQAFASAVEHAVRCGSCSPTPRRRSATASGCHGSPRTSRLQCARRRATCAWRPSQIRRRLRIWGSRARCASSPCRQPSTWTKPTSFALSTTRTDASRTPTVPRSARRSPIAPCRRSGPSCGALHAADSHIALGYPTWQAFVEAKFRPIADWPPEIADMLVAELLAPDRERAA